MIFLMAKEAREKVLIYDIETILMVLARRSFTAPSKSLRSRA